MANRNEPSFRFPSAQNQHERNLLQLRFTDLEVHPESRANYKAIRRTQPNTRRASAVCCRRVLRYWR